MMVTGNIRCKSTIIIIFILPILALIIGAAFCETGAEAGDYGDSDLVNEEDLLLLEVYLDDIRLGDDFLTAYQQEEGLLLPLGQLSGFLQLPLEVTPEEGLARGNIFEEEYRLEVKEEAAYRPDSKEIYFSSGEAEVTWDDIYVQSDLISRWLPLDITLDKYSASLNIDSDSPLPPQQEKERHYRWEQIPSDPLSYGSDVYYPRRDNPYGLFSGPFVEQRLGYGQSTGSGPSLRHRTRLSGDLFFMSGRLQVAGSLDDPISNVRGRLGRRSPEAELLGPFSAHELWLGDLSQTPVANITDRQRVQGLRVSNYPYLQPDEFYRHSFQGELSDGWEVELYKNGDLIDYQRSDKEGKYIFDNVPLTYGDNEFELIFYDEYGRKHHREKSFSVDAGLIPPGENRYRIETGRQEDKGERTAIRMGRGLTHDLTVETDYVRVPGEEDFGDYGRVSLQGSGSSGLLWQADYLQNFGGGYGGEVNLQTELGDTDFTVQHARFFEGFASEEITDLKRKTNMKLARSVAVPFSERLSDLALEFDMARKERVNDRVFYEALSRQRTSFRNFHVRNMLNMEYREDDGLQAEGEFSLRRRLDEYILRGEASYDASPFSLRTLSGEIKGSIDDHHSFNLGFNRNLITERNTYSAGLSREEAGVEVGLNASYTPEESFRAGMHVSFSYGRDGRDNTFEPDVSPRRGAVSARTYLEDGEGEKIRPVEDVGFKIDGIEREERTDDRGRTFISGLRPDRAVDVAINPETIADPYMMPDPEGVSFVPRAGQAYELDLPVVKKGELGGYVYLEKEEEMRGMRNIEVQLVDKEKEEVVAKTLTSFDGYFYMSELRPGEYELRISPDDIERLNLEAEEPKEVEIPAEGGYIDGYEFTLKQQ